MKYFSVPADFKRETIDAYAELNSKYADSRVVETYGNITVGNEVESGRAVYNLPRLDLLDLGDYLEFSRQKGIDFNYTLNGTHMNNREFTPEGLREIKVFLNKLYEVGVRSLTIALPSLFELVQSLDLGFRIRTSTLCQVTNVNKAVAYKKRGVEKMVVDESINRDFYTLKRIRQAFGEGVEIIVNPICHRDCIYRMFHYNQISADSLGVSNEVSTNFYEHRCVLQRLARLSDLLRLCWVRPEDVGYYAGIGIDYFKLQGRHTFHKGGDPVRTVRCYFDESYDGNLLDILNMFAPLNHFNVFLDNKKLEGYLKPFYEKKHFCQHDCGNCRYCDSFAPRCIDFRGAEEIIDAARTFYDDYDQFKRMLQDLAVEGAVVEGKREEEAEREMKIDFELA